MTECWRLFLCREFGNSSCLATQRSSSHDDIEENDHQVEVSDVIQLVPDDQPELEIEADDIMHQDTFPVCAADIEDQLRKQFAFLSGGRGENGCPVITFPEYPAFSEIPEKEFQNVLTYLTSVPSLQDAGIGFILVIDRRLDKWTSVKASILRIAASFPGNLQLVIVLRPSGIFQRAFSEIAFKFNKDEFKMKVPIIMLNSATELHNYIDKTQLTPELGGTLDYCHASWLLHRTAIENFAVMVKQTAQTLQSFGTELAETELPNDISSTNNLLAAHTEKKDKMKDDLWLALKQGRDILERIMEPVKENPDYRMNQDQLDNRTTVDRLLMQLNETEAAFDEFWSKHQQKLEQCLQLRRFEIEFREVKNTLDGIMERLAVFSDVGNSCSHVEHILKDLFSFEERSQKALQCALDLASEGDQLIKMNHYAVDSILPKCNELYHLCESASKQIQERREHLRLSLELHRQLEKTMEWCDEGIYLLASQPVDKFQSQDGAESALQEIEKFMETCSDNSIRDLSWVLKQYEAILTQELKEHVHKVYQKQGSMQEMFEKRKGSLRKLAAKQTRPVQPVAPRPEALSKSPNSSPGLQRASENRCTPESVLQRRSNYRRAKSEVDGNQGRSSSIMEDEENLAVLRRHVMNELIETERVYVEELLSVLEGYASEMENPLAMHLLSPTLQNKKDVLFGNMEEIYHFHNRIFLRELENYTDYPELVGRCFLERMEDFQIYEKYCQNKPRSESLWRQCSDAAFFQECQRKLDHKLSLDSYLLKPVQRITKYQLLLKEMLKYSRSCEGAEDLQEALASILGILKAVNDSMHQIAITGYEGNLNDLGKLLMQGSFNVWTEHKKGHSKVKDLARFKPMQRHLFLHEKAVLFCKKREENGEGYEKAPSYSFKHSLNMRAVGITENVKGDTKKFEIWYNAREEVYIVQAPTMEIKATWVSEIRKVLTSQLQACREASQHKSLEQTNSSPLPAPSSTSPLRSKSGKIKKLEERKTEPILSPDTNLASLPKSLEKSKASPTSPDKKAKRHEVKSDPTPFGLRGWNRTTQSLDVSEENNDGWSSGEDQINSSDAEEDGGETNDKKLSPGEYTVVRDCEKCSAEELPVKSGDIVQLIREEEDGVWYVKNLSTSRDGFVTASNLMILIGTSKSAHSLSSSESGTASSTLSTSSSCSESCNVSSTSFSDIKS
ncbi:guanine nucleotide exchange factor DBS isoform X2 [Spea bombifrons]|uniref:guanine nucleotide exchange factor DBS isoform X2 n=1 Tax=Spea bombifrons TaxID=233779 RepID=UPI00234A311E|nr:guanine nucleotide exchange factor DBS isoform X2 [Spea bombifrons]